MYCQYFIEATHESDHTVFPITSITIVLVPLIALKFSTRFGAIRLYYVPALLEYCNCE